MRTTRCPLCKSNIIVRHRPWLGQSIRCLSCEAILEVVFLNPLELESTYDVQDSRFDDSLYYKELDYIE